MTPPPPPANLEPFVRVLGVDLALKFFDAFGGAELYLPRNPHRMRESRLVELVGREKAMELAAACEGLPRRIPLGKRWAAQVHRAQGLPVAEIARRLRASDVAVRRWLAPPADLAQGELPL